MQDLRSSNGTIVDGTLLKTKKKGKKKPVGGTCSVDLTSGVSTVEVWLNGPRTHLLMHCRHCQTQPLPLPLLELAAPCDPILACNAQKSEQKSFD
eukprot:COSAG02_NODE_14362_length_1280_cov_1.475021_2_plen_95_part_00